MGKTEESDKQTFKTVDFFIRVKKQIAEETYDMTFEELKEYLRRRKLKAND